MKTVGIVAEYDPFHRGHQHHLNEALRLSGADHAMVVLSSWFTQRGDPALISPQVRAGLALHAGAGVVFALPCCWVLRDAVHYALGAVSLLHHLGADAIAFGAEHPDLPLLRETADLLENEPSEFRSGLADALERGNGYPSALQAAVSHVFPEAADLIRCPNDTLAICYLRAIKKLGSGMTPVPVQRIGSHGRLSDCQGYPSASMLRSLILRGDWPAFRLSVSTGTADAVLSEAEKGLIHDPSLLDTALLYRLRSMPVAEYASLPDTQEGLDRLLYAASEAVTGRAQIIESISGKRYPRARINRLCSHALLQITASQLEAEPLPDAGWLLGLRRDSQALLKRISDTGFPIISRASDDVHRDRAWFQTEVLASRLWYLGCGCGSMNALNARMVTV